MSSAVLRIGSLVGLLCLAMLLTAPVLADDTQHEHPDDVDEGGDLEGAERWLSERMGEVHVDCADDIGVGSFDACEDLDEEYTELLDRYVTVENDLRSETETAETFNETRAQQREYAELREEFDETFEAYKTARAAGNDEEALALARELQRLAERIEELGGEIEVNFTELDERSTTDYENASRTINESTAEVRRVRLNVESELFEKTEITAAADETASFSAPAIVSGHVASQNGTAIDTGDVVISDGRQQFTTTPTSNGSYELGYQPALTTVGETNLTVRYRPAAGEPYLRSETMTNVTVRSTASELRIKNSSNRAAFGDAIVITGIVTAEEQNVSGVNVSMRADEATFETTETGADGTFRLSARVPATMEATTHRIVVQASETGRALEPTRRMESVTIEETQTELRARAAAKNSTIEVTGQLTTETENDARIGSRQLAVEIGSETYTVRTDEDGYYNLSAATTAEPATVTVTYDGNETNLAHSQAEATVAYDRDIVEIALLTIRSAGANALAFVRGSPFISLAGVLGTISVLWFALPRLRRWYRTDSSDEYEATAPTEITDEQAESASGSTEVTAQTLLNTARETLRTDPKTAVYASYAAVRARFNANPDQTHWELYDRYGSSSDTDSSEPLFTLIQTFERAAFAAEDVQTSQARLAVEAAEQYLETPHDDLPTD